MNGAGILKKVLEISGLQRELLSQGRLAEALQGQMIREGLIEEFKTAENGALKPVDAEALTIAKKIMESDNILNMQANAELDGLKAKLARITSGKMAFKAYSSASR